MRRYETIYILRPNLGEEEINTVVDYVGQIITDEGGTVIDLNKWGMKKLAYLIKKESLGYYIYCDYAATPAAVAEIERKFRIDDSVLKYMTIKLADSISEEQIQQAVEEISSRENASAPEETPEQKETDAKTAEESEKVDEKPDEETTE
jgi:small subunit ribosomal protein S6